MIISWAGRKNTIPKIAKKPRPQLPCCTPPRLGQTTEQTPICAVIGRGHSRHVENEVQLATTVVAKIRGNSTVSFGTASCRSNLEWYSTCPNFMSNVDPWKWWSFVEAWIVSFEKGSFAWKEAVIAQSHNLDVQSFSNSLLWARSWEFFVLSGLENPCLGNLENPLTNSCTNATYQIQNKPILFGVPTRDVRNELHLCPTKTPNAISCGLGPSFPSRCTNFQLLTHHLSYHSCEALKHFWCPSLMTSSN